ncbi:MAG: hypothetical protein A2946_01060 [Candidatus Liptonbacteria bacterium RIFCSPLOWO2_01_FULL_53_13]|uniref:Nudix hydrolase domain-containing protein n=1 Tax=Candidatus Liptonbacteria bacterium RIFCSPLOWO2_01_FULL_53_13 TaxID=1798651 RepID=A0A1G2CJ70_9BACT|nr:MAG: hypothetical protein A2946_01060 [Candidatus Liptonbacteria bacterium RIFCSPLOWO2_01_FULL_53_13]
MSKELRPKGAIGVYLINQKGELLLLLRTSPHGNGTWSPPGGHMEYGETFSDTAKRETKEESGVEVGDIEIMGVTSDVYPEEEKHYVTVHVKALTYSGEPRIAEPNKCKEMKWFNLGNLPENLFPANKHFFAQNPDCPCESGRKYKTCHGR